ncbi:MAG: multi-sensor signal transduction histidine kinase [Bacteroidetes bacterium]|nr:MAG: multi-sensor signal transduction histidine kinase [Bacteroidota bacterium]
MNLTIKHKLRIGLLFLFAVIVIIGVLGGIFLSRLSKESKAIIKANYESIVYTKNMFEACDRFSSGFDQQSKTLFLGNLEKQENNVTESGEKELTDRLGLLFKKLENDTGSTRMAVLAEIRSTLFGIQDLNLKAIVQKNEKANNTAENVILWMSVIGSIAVLLSLVFVVRFPGYIANPIRELDLAKTNFIATVSHELKTPISAIKLSLNLLEDPRVGQLNEEQAKLAECIRDESNRLLKITGELLDMAQVETGKIGLEIQPVRPEEIVQYALKAVSAPAAQKEILLRLNMPEKLPMVSADAEKSAWVLINLLSNAIRYAPEKSTVDIRIAGQDYGVRFSVTDQGKGIPDEYKHHLFEKFFRAPGLKTEGTGLGLAIAKEFIETQKGHIGLVSENGKGAEFWFILPAATAL